MLAEMDPSGDLHFVFARDAIRLHPPEGSLATTEDLSVEKLRQLFLTSHREIWHEHEVWHVSWKERENQETCTWFESASGARRCIKAQWPFPFVSEAELADAMRGATDAP